MWLAQGERVTLAVLGALALAGWGVLAWLQQRRPFEFAPRPAQAASRGGQGPVGEPSPARAAPWDEALRSARLVNVNTATAAELERLPQVGPTLARRIVAYRQRHGRFRTSEELVRVEGIGPKTYDALEGYVTAE
jgi:competence protein ComEA